MLGNPDHSNVSDSNLKYSGFQPGVFQIPTSGIPDSSLQNITDSI